MAQQNLAREPYCFVATVAATPAMAKTVDNDNRFKKPRKVSNQSAS